MLTILRRRADNIKMVTFLPAHINCLESQVESYAAAQPMNRADVEELMSLFISLAGELEKSTANVQLPNSDLLPAMAQFKRLAAVGGRIRVMATRLRKDGHAVSGIDPF